jgi:glucosyl-3-phosphoglycerate phosphatase
MLSPRLVLVRHGQSTYNARAVLQGQADPPLSDAGRAEAERLRAALPPFPPERVITSDLIRASETAAILGYPQARRDVRWREIDVADWAGRPLSEFPSETLTAWRGGQISAPGGETWADLVARVGGAVDELEGEWLIVCHGGAVRAALTYVTGIDPQRVAGPANASVTVLAAGQVERYAWTPKLSDR